MIEYIQFKSYAAVGSYVSFRKSPNESEPPACRPTKNLSHGRQDDGNPGFGSPYAAGILLMTMAGAPEGVCMCENVCSYIHIYPNIYLSIDLSIYLTT